MLNDKSNHEDEVKHLEKAAQDAHYANKHEEHLLQHQAEDAALESTHLSVV